MFESFFIFLERRRRVFVCVVKNCFKETQSARQHTHTYGGSELVPYSRQLLDCLSVALSFDFTADFKPKPLQRQEIRFLFCRSIN